MGGGGGAVTRRVWGLREGDGAQRERHAERLEGRERRGVFQTEMVVRKRREAQHDRLRVETGSTRDGGVRGCSGAVGQGEGCNGRHLVSTSLALLLSTGSTASSTVMCLRSVPLK